MNVLMINPVHPSTPHISATRAWQFAQGLSELGHKVVLVCSANNENQITDGADISQHNWTKPYILAPSKLTTTIYSGPSLFRKIRTLGNMLYSGGSQYLWKKKSELLVESLSVTFKPDIIWATFGSLESIYSAKKLSNKLKVPWVLDLKDNWNQYIPKMIRPIISWRCKGYSALIGNAQFPLDIASKSGFVDGEVIYSGVHEAYFIENKFKKNSKFHINIVGGLYFDMQTEKLLNGIRLYLEANDICSAEHAEIRYFGAEEERFISNSIKTGINAITSNYGYLPIEKMANLCADADVNAYVCNNVNFHHKLLELLASGVPILAFGGDIAEARMLAGSVGAQFYEPTSEDEVISALTNISTKTGSAIDSKLRLNKFKWQAMCKNLEQLLIKVIGHG